MAIRTMIYKLQGLILSSFLLSRAIKLPGVIESFVVLHREAQPHEFPGRQHERSFVLMLGHLSILFGVEGSKLRFVIFDGVGRLDQLVSEGGSWLP